MCGPDSTVVHIETDEGIDGVGETCPVGRTYLPAFAHVQETRAGRRTVLGSIRGANCLNCHDEKGN